MLIRCWVVVAVFLVSSSATADVVAFTNREVWQVAVGGNYSTIDFTGYPDGTVIDNEYVDQGLTFTSLTFTFASAAAVNDDWGLFGPAGVRFTFDSPRNWVAVDYPGGVKFQLFNDGELLYTSEFFQPGGLGNFAGLVSDMSFDEVYIFRPPPFVNEVFIDDLHWGPAIPAPGAVALCCVIGLSARRRRA